MWWPWRALVLAACTGVCWVRGQCEGILQQCAGEPCTEGVEDLSMLQSQKSRRTAVRVPAAEVKQLFVDAGVTNFSTIASLCGGGTGGIMDSASVPKVWEGYDLDAFWNTVGMLQNIDVPLYLGESAMEGAVIVAGMFGQFFVEGYNFQICDESVWNDNCNGPCSCGQFGHDYTNGSAYTLPPACALDTSMEINAAIDNNNAKFAKGQMECTPGTSSAGCCWWGRGPTQLTGRHNMYKLQSWLTANVGIVGIADGDMCSNPGLLCKPNAMTSTGATLVWLSSLQYWIDSVQGNTNFMPQLKTFMQNHADVASRHVSIATASELVNQTPASWPSGIGGAINNAVWSNLAQSNHARVCGFLRVLRLLNMMGNGTTGTPYPNCNLNWHTDSPHECCSFTGGSTCSSTSYWCNESPPNCETCGGTWVI